MKEELLEKWKKEIGAIPDNTCPKIDKLIKSHNELLKNLSYLEKQANRYDSVEELLKDFPSTWNDDVESLAENLRKDNEQLREIGKYWYEKSKELLEELENLKEWNKIHGFN